MKKPQKVKQNKTKKKKQVDISAWEKEWEISYEKSRKSGRFIWEDGIC